MKKLVLIFVTLLSFTINAEQEKLTIGLSVWSDYPESVRGFKDALAEGGFIEGTDIEFLHRNALSNKESQQKIATEFFSRDVDMVYSLTTPGTVIIKKTLSEQTPIVFSIVTYPADAGLIESMEYSANNLVGTSNYVPEKFFYEIIEGVFPHAKSVLVFHRYGEPNSKIQAVNLKRLIKKTGADVKIVSAKSLEDLEKKAKKYIDKLKPEVLVTTTDTLMQNGGEEILAKIAKKSKLAILSSNKLGIEAGATLGPVADFKILGSVSGLMAVKILKESTLPTHIASKYMQPPLILVNKEAHKKLGLTIPEHFKNVRYVD